MNGLGLKIRRYLVDPTVIHNRALKFHLENPQRRAKPYCATL